MKLNCYKYVEIKGAMKQTHRRVAVESAKPLKLGTVIDFELNYDCDHVLWHVVNDTDIEDEKEFEMPAELVENVWYLQTSTTYKGEHKIKAICFDQDDNKLGETEEFILNVK